jgi:hypothetical protein
MPTFLKHCPHGSRSKHGIPELALPSNIVSVSITPFLLRVQHAGLPPQADRGVGHVALPEGVRTARLASTLSRASGGCALRDLPDGHRRTAQLGRICGCLNTCHPAVSKLPPSTTLIQCNRFAHARRSQSRRSGPPSEKFFEGLSRLTRLCNARVDRPFADSCLAAAASFLLGRNP